MRRYSLLLQKVGKVDRINSMYIAIDVGGTNTRIAASESLATPLLVQRVEYANTHDFQTDYARMISEIHKISTEITAIGISFPGDWTGNPNKLSLPTHNIDWEDKPFVQTISKEFGCPVYIENDAVCGARGTAYHEKVSNDFVYITWGTGIGGAQVTHDADTVVATQLVWATYLKSFEGACGGANLEKKYSKPGEELSEEEWQTVMSDFESEFKSFIDALRPSHIIIGGGITTKQKSRLENTISHLENISSNLPKISISTLGDDAGLYGALEMIRNQ